MYSFDALCNPASPMRHIRPRMSGKIAFVSGGSSATESTVTQTNLPEYAEPYFTRLMERAEGLSLAEYTPYTGPRLTEMDPMTSQSYAMIGDIAQQPIAGLDTAQQASTAAMMGGFGAAGAAQPYQYSQYGFSDPGTFTGDVVQEYMSPYVENVLQRQMAEQQRQFDLQQGARDADAVAAGAFGGSRRFVTDALAQEATNRQMQDIYASGMQTAFEQAAGQFGADRAARMQAETAQAGELGRVQSGQAAEDRAALDQQLQALGFGAEQGAQLATHGAKQREADVQMAQLLETAGKAKEAYDQAGLDIAYDDFLRQQGFPESQLQLLSSIIRGVPISPTQTTTTYTPSNPIQEALGAGISALGLYKGLS